MTKIGEKRAVKTVLAVSVILAVGPAMLLRGAVAAERLAYSSDASRIQEEIKVRGARAVVAELYGHGEVPSADWEYVMHQIESGSVDWLHVAVALHPGSDAGSSEMLGEAVDIALVRAPKSVLQVAIPAFDLAIVCGGRQDPLPTYADASAELEAQIAAVESLKSKELAAVRSRCLEQLKQERANLTRFFEVK